ETADRTPDCRPHGGCRPHGSWRPDSWHAARARQHAPRNCPGAGHADHAARGASTLLAIARGPGTRTTPHPGALLATAGLADRTLRALPGACARARPQLDAVRPRREHPREEHGPGHGAQ